MIKSSIQPAKPEEKPFPKLMINSEGVVVLFSALKSGMVIAAVRDFAPGYHCGIWDMNEFEDFSGSVTLSN